MTSSLILLLSLQTSTALRVLGLQVATVSGQTNENCKRAEAMVQAYPGHDLYVLPELSCHGYNDDVLAAAEQHAQASDGTIGRFFCQLAQEAKAHVCYGFLRRTADGDITICQAVAAPTGEIVCVYDKMHLCDMGACSEVGYGLTCGRAPASFDCNGVRVGITVCYDLRFPELYRSLAWDGGCDLILHPSAFIRDPTFPSYHQFVTTRALENGVYVLSVTHAGPSFGDSLTAPPWLGPVPGIAEGLASSKLGTEEGVLPLVVEPAVLEAVRNAYPYRRDVHPMLRASGPIS
eukprot:CAMPEP_0174745030 /NCGR_PEP_ID=MMETSP1094-20130205/85883_1 /TAXON_ID=156173 /ORGANISM="Chrysochromulina brevifilum, Strain UTEX LB 985" /LENGTH=290 /DNA_ID=CAMNT_0015949523 /DNA_START=177 /DNA_END=1046 /DNA_ORIENTATION=+